MKHFLVFATLLLAPLATLRAAADTPTDRVIHSSRSVGFTGWVGGVAAFNRALNAEDLEKLSAINRARPITAQGVK